MPQICQELEVTLLPIWNIPSFYKRDFHSQLYEPTYTTGSDVLRSFLPVSYSIENNH